ncbi:hypothetical protein LSCM1_02774 [Leishmania martiniquensis]|uniref:CCHC-type domain-containing protein n=1 Tax=Leishmania martiniquensis TaxID=1580590 RepID=A0A836KD93_9TRYP|nr:hypothetical protein LSCM1_02774 [Leishmania martiniquensis]
MTSRIPLPLRLVQCDWWLATESGRSSSGSVSARSRVLTAYKPSGLPCYAASQVSAVAASGGDGRRLCAIHTRHTHPASYSTPIVAAGPQPHPDDPSDSLLTRVVDSALPGCAPYVALPVVSSLLRRGGHDTAAAAQLNQWTSRHKGVVVLTQTPSDALFLRNAAQLDLVQQTYRVVCRLPAGVASAVRRYLRTHLSGTQLGKATNGASTAPGMLNPYLQAHRERRREQQALVDLNVGIPLSAESLSATTKARAVSVSTLASDARLPPSVRPHPLVTGGFFDVARGQLRVRSNLKCYIRAQAPLTEPSAARVHQWSRLQSLFRAPAAATLGHGCGASDPIEDTSELRHPWMRSSWRLGVSVDAPYMQCAVAGVGEGDGDDRRSSVPAPRGKLLSMEVQLVSLSPRDDSDMALYEVHTHGDTTADEVAAVFQAEGLRVINDYVQDVSLAMAVEEVATRMRVAPPGLLQELPMGLQHRLRSATAEELVALPLTRMPLEDADRLATQHTLQQLSSLPSLLPFSDDVDQLRQVVAAAASPAVSNTRHPLQRLLLHALSSFDLTKETDRRVYEQVMALTLGNGVECTGVVFPDPSDAGNVHVLQQLWLTYEQQRQRYPSLADAVRAARQHPLASSLRYTTRTVLNDSAGLARVPLLADVMAGAALGMAAEVCSPARIGDVCGARGECSFTQAVELCSTFSCSPTLKARYRLGDDDAGGQMASALTSFNHPVARWLQTEVPPPYETAFQEWCAASAAPSCCADAAAAGVEIVSLWPSPQSLLGRCHVPRTWDDDRSEPVAKRPRASDDSSHAAATLQETLAEHIRLPVRVFLRVEELAELQCAHCGGVGHTWQHCVVRVSEAMAAVEGDGAAAKHSLLPERIARTADALPVSEVMPAILESSVMESEGLTSTDDAVAALAEERGALAQHRRQQQLVCIGGDGGASASRSSPLSPLAVDTPPIAVPNIAATQRFKAEHALRNESGKPVMHRRAMRCVYCGGRHHVAACPTLRAQDSESDARSADAAGDAAPGPTASLPGSRESEPLPFCIKCGRTGHLYTRCRDVPVHLHHATHCPICLQARTKASHDPVHCPQRVPAPEGYRLDGIPALTKEDSKHSKTSPWRSSSRPQALFDEGRREAVTDRHQRIRGKRAGGTPSQRRRRGSVLIADSFIDGK